MITTFFNLKIVFLTPVLGSQPGDPELASAHIAKRHGLAGLPGRDDEYLEDSIDRGTTRFYRCGPNDDRPALMNYQLLGFLKESGSVQNGRIDGGDGWIRNLRWKVERNVFITPRILPLNLPAGGELDFYERPLRGNGPGGPRVVLARSEILPEGCWFTCGVEVLESEINESALRDLLDYGFHRGLCQWRGSGAFGTFRYELKAG